MNVKSCAVIWFHESDYYIVGHGKNVRGMDGLVPAGRS